MRRNRCWSGSPRKRASSSDFSVVDGDRLTWVAKAQGARSGLRYDPEMGSEVRLSCSATGFAWLSCMTDKEAVALRREAGLWHAR